jgi:hypothetical protein
MVLDVEVVPVPSAPLGASDATRRWGVLCADGHTRWPGVTRVEADAACRGLAATGSDSPGAALLGVELGVVLSDGAGPYVVDADGVLVLVLDRHAHIPECSFAMGQVDRDRVRLGLVRDRGAHGIWEWVTQADVAVTDRVTVLDRLAAAETLEAISRGWDAPDPWSICPDLP